jgi:hypothetical protein
MTHTMFDRPEDLPALASYAELLPTIPALAPVLLHASELVPVMMATLGGVTDVAVLEAQAADPNCAVEALAFLAGPFPAAFSANPALELLLLENPSLPAEMPLVSLGRLLAYAGVPADFVAAVAAYGQPEMALAARLHVALAGEADADWRTELDVALGRLTIFPEDDLLLVLATLGLLPAWLQRRLAQLERVALALAGRPVATEHELIDAALPVRRAAQAADSAQPREVLLAFADDEDAAVRAAMAANPAMLPEDLAELKAREDQFDNDPVVYKALAANPRTPPTVLIALAANQLALFTGVRRAVARNPAAPPEALELLADEPYAADIRLAVVAHTNVSAAQREKLERASLEAALGSGDPIYRAVALSQPGAPPRALELALDSPHWIERLALALNPAATDAALIRLGADGNRLVGAAARETAAQRSSR